MIGRRAFLASGALALMSPGVGGAQQVPRPRSVLLTGLDHRSVPGAERVERFLSAMTSLGYAEGRDFRMEYWPVAANPALQPDMLRAVPSADVVLASNAMWARLVSPVAPAVPVVAVLLNDEESQLDLVGPNFARPKGNVTGIGAVGDSGTSFAKLLDIARDMTPGLRTIGYLQTAEVAARPEGVAGREANEAIARAAGHRIVTVIQANRAPVDATLDQFRREGAQVVITGFQFLDDSIAPQFNTFSKVWRIPVFYNRIENVEAGGLLSYGVDNRDNYTYAASFVDRLFRGAKVADLPLRQEVDYRLAVNMKAAREQGFEIPARVLATADAVIE